MTNRQDCKTCRNTFKIRFWDSDKAKARKKNGPPCQTCWPGVMEANRSIFDVYLRCRNQWITGAMGGLIAIRSEAVESAMRVCGIKRADRLKVYDAVTAIGDKIAATRNKKSKDA